MLGGTLGGVIQYGLRTNIASEPSSSDNLSYQCKRWRRELHTSMQYNTTIIPGTLVCKKGKQHAEVVYMEVWLHACSRRVGSNDETSVYMLCCGGLVGLCAMEGLCRGDVL